MSKYRGHWETASHFVEEWRLARDEYRNARKTGTPLPEVEDSETSEVKAHFRRVHPNKRPVELHTTVFVHQHALRFGADAKPPRHRRPVLVLRSDPWLREIIGAPLTTRTQANVRTMLIPREAPGLVWNQTARPRDGYLYDSPEFVGWAHIRRTDSDSPAATIGEPLLTAVLAFVFVPAVAAVH